MSDIRKYKVAPTDTLHLRDANEAFMYADDGEGKPDKTKPIVAHLYGMGSKQHARWTTIAANRFVQRLKKRGGRSDQTPEERAEERVEQLLAYTQSIDNLAYGALTGEAAVRATYEDQELGFIADQVLEHIGSWSNFSKPSTAS